jgi:hypothetical protein
MFSRRKPVIFRCKSLDQNNFCELVLYRVVSICSGFLEISHGLNYQEHRLHYIYIGPLRRIVHLSYKSTSIIDCIDYREAIAGVSPRLLTTVHRL